jgi:hypothetical protein
MTSLALLALVDVLALIGSVLFVWRAVKRLWRFAGAARRNSLEVALRRVRQISCRQAMRCATDVSYYNSRLALLFAANMVSVTGLIFAAVCLANVERPPAGGPSGWTEFASASLLIFTVLSLRSFYRTIRLARQVLQIRRKVRSVEARKRRLALGGEQSRMPAHRLGLVQL